MNPRVSSYKRQSGLSYIEILVAMIIIGVSIVPVVSALRNSMMAAELDSLTTVRTFHLMAKMEEVLSQSFDTLSAQAIGTDSAGPFSDDAGSENRRLVYISEYDGDNADADDAVFTGTDAGLLWIQVEIENSNHRITALKSDL